MNLWSVSPSVNVASLKAPPLPSTNPLGPVCPRLVRTFSGVIVAAQTTLSKPGPSSSATITCRTTSSTPEALWVMAAKRTLASLRTSSFTPVTVTVWGVFQFAWLKLSVPGETVATVASEVATVTVTTFVGRLLSLTV